MLQKADSLQFGEIKMNKYNEKELNYSISSKNAKLHERLKFDTIVSRANKYVGYEKFRSLNSSIYELNKETNSYVRFTNNKHEFCVNFAN